MKEGWSPLCKFLDLPIPSTPFPRVNDKAKMQMTMTGFRVLAWTLFVALPMAAALAVYWGYFCQ